MAIISVVYTEPWVIGLFSSAVTPSSMARWICDSVSWAVSAISGTPAASSLARVAGLAKCSSSTMAAKQPSSAGNVSAATASAVMPRRRRLLCRLARVRSSQSTSSSRPFSKSGRDRDFI